MKHIKDLDPNVCIVLVNYNGWQDTLECVDSLLSIKYSNCNIVIVDNGSIDNSVHKLIVSLEKKISTLNNSAEFGSNIKNPIKFKFYTQDEIENNLNLSLRLYKITLIQSRINLGFAGGNNLATKFALTEDGASFFWYLNNDTVVHENALFNLVYYFKVNFNLRSNNLGIVGSKLKYYHNPEMIQAIGGKYNKWSASTKHIGANQIDVGQFDFAVQTSHIDYIVGASMLVSKDFINQVGLMNPDYFLYFEEIDWITRGKTKGFTIGYSAQSIIYHKEGKSTGGNGNNPYKSYLADFYNIKNRIKFTKIYYPECLVTVYLYLFGSMFNRLKRRQFARITMILRIIYDSIITFK